MEIELAEHEKLAAQVKNPSDEEIYGKVSEILGLLAGFPVSQAIRTLKESKGWLLDSLMVDGGQDRFILRRKELEAFSRRST